MRCVIFSGTTEGRRLSQELARLGWAVAVCVATGYGREEQGEIPGVAVLAGRMDEEEMARTLRGADLCVDATHPYAVQASRSVRAACAGERVPLLRLLREESPVPEGAAVLSTAQEAADWLSATRGSILLTTGARSWTPSPPWAGSGCTPGCCPWRPAWRRAGGRGCPPAISWPCKGPFRRS